MSALDYKAWSSGQRVRPCRDLGEAAEALLAARERGADCRVVACVTLRRDRELTAAELHELIETATKAAT